MKLSERIAQMKAMQDRIPNLLANAAAAATMRAVEKAIELTPPTGSDLKGTNTRTGEMKQSWAERSKTVPQRVGNTYVTELNNGKEYASYVNDGHRMDRHFVPGLVIDGGMLSYNPDGKGGIIVGTKTQYVEGLFMVDAAKEEYRRVLREQLEGLI